MGKNKKNKKKQSVGPKFSEAGAQGSQGHEKHQVTEPPSPCKSDESSPRQDSSKPTEPLTDPLKPEDFPVGFQPGPPRYHEGQPNPISESHKTNEPSEQKQSWRRDKSQNESQPSSRPAERSQKPTQQDLSWRSQANQCKGQRPPPGFGSQPKNRPGPSSPTSRGSEPSTSNPPAQKKPQSQQMHSQQPVLNVPIQSRQCAPTQAPQSQNQQAFNQSAKNGHQAPVKNGKNGTSTAGALSRLSLKDKEFPQRKGQYGTVGRPIRLKANHFEVNVNLTGCLQQYHLEITPNKLLTKGKRRKIVYILIEKHQKIFGGDFPVYDGDKIVYTKEPLPGINGRETLLKVTLPPDRPNKKDETYDISIKWVHEVSLDALNDFIQGQQAHNGGITSVHDAITALDMVFQQLPNMEYTRIGYGFYIDALIRPENLFEGAELWTGFKQSVRPQWKRIAVIVNTSNVAVYKRQRLVDLIYEKYRLKNADFNGTLNPNLRQRIEKDLYGVKVETNHVGKRKMKITGISQRSAKQETFQLDDGNWTNVADYFKNTYNIDLEYPDFNCVQTGGKKACIPMELCMVVEGQRCSSNLTDQQKATMIKKTALPAPDRRKRIEEMVKGANYANDPFLNHYGLRVNTSMTDVNGRVLPPPTIEFAKTNPQQRGRTVESRNGVWRLNQKDEFWRVAPVVVDDWVLLSFASGQRDPSEKDLTQFASELCKHGRYHGMGMELSGMNLLLIRDRDPDRVMDRIFDQECYGRKLVLVILPSIAAVSKKVYNEVKSKKVYNEVKRMGDVVMGIPTQCIAANNVRKALDPRGAAMFLTNILFKINTRLGGFNTIPVPAEKLSRIFSRPFIVIGADVTHPAAHDKTWPSIAAVVASMNKNCAKYKATAVVQQHRNEIIQELSDIVYDMLKKFIETNRNFKPEKILFFRDGVSEGQFHIICEQELAAVQSACKRIEDKYEPGITFIVVQKRHQTRLFCEDERDAQGKSKNVPAGVVVDRDITHPVDSDYFICSHEGIQGTSKPCHYYPLHDDNDLTPDEFQILSNHLCYVYANCTRSISYPAPVYYADKAASHAKAYIAHIMDRGNRSAQVDQNLQPTQEMRDAVRVHPNINDTMYFI